MHQPVLLKEVLDGLMVKPDGCYIDGTFGRGGHSRAILKQLSSNGRLLAMDKDIEAILYARQQLGDDKRFEIVHDSFANIEAVAKMAGAYGQVDGILLDLGVSSPQLDTPERGFSFMRDGPLDMRMDASKGLSASEYVNKATVADMTEIFRTLGEERYAKRIAEAIAKMRTNTPILTTELLARVVKEAHPRWEKHKHPATRVFQAIRMHINQELDDLKKGLNGAFNVLGVGGRLAVISFHSLEDRMVKRFMKEKAVGHRLPMGVPIKSCDEVSQFKCIGKRKPQKEEIDSNIRARSAVLRIGEKTI